MTRRAHQIAPRTAWVAATALLAAALLCPPAPAQEREPFYTDLLEEGIRSYRQGDLTNAVEELRIAAFGLLGAPTTLGRALAFLAAAQDGAGDVDGFERTYRRLIDLEAGFRSYSEAALDADVRAVVDLAGSRHLGRPIQPAASTPAPAAVMTAETPTEAEVSRPQVCISWKGDGDCKPTALTPAPKLAPGPAPGPAEAASFDRLSQLAFGKASDRELRRGYEQAAALADRFGEWSEIQRIAGVLASRSGAYDAAVRYYDQAGMSVDDRPRHLFYLAVALFETNHLDEAATVLRRALPALEQSKEVRRYVRRILKDESAA